MNGVNLIPASRLEASSRRTRVRMWAGVLLAATVVMTAGAITFRAFWSLESGPVQSEIAAAQATRQAADAKLIKVTGEIATLRRADLTARMVGEHPDWSVLLRAINQARGDGVSLESFDLSTAPPPAPPPVAPGETKPPPTPRAVERYTLKMKGIATDLNRVMAFVDKLEKLKVMESVAMKQSRAEPKGGITVTGFDIECALAERAPDAPSSAPATADASAKEDRP